MRPAAFWETLGLIFLGQVLAFLFGVWLGTIGL